MRPTIGTRLKELRLARKLRQEQVAQIIGVNRTAVSSYETGVRQPSFDTLVSLARLYRVSSDYLLGMTDVRTLDITGLTEPEVEILSALVQNMAQKNKMLNRR